MRLVFHFRVLILAHIIAFVAPTGGLYMHSFILYIIIIIIYYALDSGAALDKPFLLHFDANFI